MSDRTPDSATNCSRRRVLAGLAAGVVGTSGCTVRLPSENLDSSWGVGPSTATPTPVGDIDAETSSTAESVGKRVRESVVTIDGALSGRRRAGGTGWYYGDGYFLTNHHIVDQTSELEAWTIGGENHELEVVDSSPSPDIALVRAADPDSVSASLPSLPRDDATSIERGTPVLHVGHPYAVGNWVVAAGKYLGHETRYGLKTNVPSMRGFSGSPLVDLDGSVLGMTWGSIPRESRRRVVGEGPEPVPPTVHTDFEDVEWTMHVPIDDIESAVETWRSP